MAHPLTGDIPLESYVQADYTLAQVLQRQVPFPPEGGHVSVNPNIINKDNLNLQSAIPAPNLDELHASLPHWQIPARPGDGNQIPWWVVYPYHPVIDTFGPGRSQVPVPHCFLDTAEIDDEARPDVFNTLPDALQAQWGNLLINTRFRFIIYHTKKPIRVKAATHFGTRLNNSTPYFRTIRERDRNTPLPTAPQHIIAQRQALLNKCREVFLGRRRPYNPQHLFNPFVTSFGLEVVSFGGPGALPAGPLPQDPSLACRHGRGASRSTSRPKRNLRADSPPIASTRHFSPSYRSHSPFAFPSASRRTWRNGSGHQRVLDLSHSRCFSTPTS